MLHPSQNRRVRQPDAALTPHADYIPVAQLETQVPPNAQHHNLRIEMAIGEQLFDRNRSGHSPIFAHAADFAPEPDLSTRLPPRVLCRFWALGGDGH
jgi:hypothetical protein